VLLPIEACIDVMAGALASLARGVVHQPLRMVVHPPGSPGLFALMPSYAAVPEPSFGLKVIGVFPGNVARGRDAHQGAVLLVSGETGSLLALINASALTAIRTAAVSAVATRLLAREDASELAIIGSGVQARTHLAAIASVRKIRRARIASRRLERARAFVTQNSSSVPFPLEAVAGAEAAVRGADVIVTVTNSREPVLRREWISAGAHLNAVGASQSTSRELDSETVAAARFFVDRRESAESESGDYLVPLLEESIGSGHIRAEIGEVLIGLQPGRTAPEEITLFKSLGLAVEDLAAAAYVYRRARAAGAGTWVEF